jgi:crotonobetainyl-CoA:carnitine CoA-transferase CaiB-like acyl-CoA transferase
MVAQGGADTPVIQPMSLHDIGTGTLAALGTVVALYERLHSGEGQRAEVALSRTSVAFQAGEYTTYPDRPDARVGYIDYVGDDAAHRYVEASDGWLGVCADTAEQRRAWDAIRGADDVGLKSVTVDEVVAACRDAGIPAVAVLGRDEVYTSEALFADESWLVVDDDDLGEVRVMRSYSEWDGVPPRTRAAMHAAGRDTEAVLSEVSAGG